MRTTFTQTRRRACPRPRRGAAAPPRPRSPRPYCCEQSRSPPPPPPPRRRRACIDRCSGEFGACFQPPRAPACWPNRRALALARTAALRRPGPKRRSTRPKRAPTAGVTLYEANFRIRYTLHGTARRMPFRPTASGRRQMQGSWTPLRRLPNLCFKHESAHAAAFSFCPEAIRHAVKMVAGPVRR